MTKATPDEHLQYLAFCLLERLQDHDDLIQDFVVYRSSHTENNLESEPIVAITLKLFEVWSESSNGIKWIFGVTARPKGERFDLLAFTVEST